MYFFLNYQFYSKEDTILIINFIGLGTSFAFLFLGITSTKMEEKKAQKFG
jgi:hypothetical protein